MKLATLLLLLAACATPPKSTLTPRSVTPIAASFAKTWNAVIDVFAQQNIAIRTIDRASGFIAADAAFVAAKKETARAWADCGSDGIGVVLEPEAASYNVLARGDSGSSTVHVTVTWTTLVGRQNMQCVSKGVWEGELEQLIRAKAEGN